MRQIFIRDVLITPGTPVAPGQGVMIVATVAGVVALKMAQEGILPVAVDVGTNRFDGLAVKDVVAAQTTATASVYNMYE